MNLVILYIIIYSVFWWFTRGLLWAGSILFASSVCEQAFAIASRLAMYRGFFTPQKYCFFYLYEINFHDRWYSHLKTPKKKHNVIYDLRTSCRMALCMSNKRVSFRRIFRYAEKIWIVSTAKEGDTIYCRRCNWSLLRHRLIRMAAQLLWMVICPL